VLVMLDGTGRLLDPSFNVVGVLEGYRGELIRQRLSPRRALRRARAALGDLDELAEGVPRFLRDMLRAAGRGGVAVRLEHHHLEPSVNRLVWGMLTSALFVGSALLWAFSAAPLVSGVSAAGVLGVAVSGVLGFRLFRAIRRSGRLDDRQ
jgi:ubiquinone biosynthesis protein